MSAQPKLQSQGVCSACDALWREYAHAMAEYLKVQLDLYMAVSNRDAELEARFCERLIDAETRREAARTQIRQHEDCRH
jgi:hypothetical protein